jgi:sterol desaturase/sphingolipid hydroxylase (fatty acid hydroxylase superfamily)
MDSDHAKAPVGTASSLGAGLGPLPSSRIASNRAAIVYLGLALLLVAVAVVGSGTDTVLGRWVAFLAAGSPFQEVVAEAAGASAPAQQMATILGPFSEIAAQVSDALYVAVMPPLRNSLNWFILLVTLVLAVALYVLRGGRGAKGSDGEERPASLREYLLPRAIYTHPSARVDIGLYLIDHAVMVFWALLFLGTLVPRIEAAVIASLTNVFGESPHLQMSLGWQLGYGLVTLLAVDLAFFLYHLMMHRTRIGWAIHQVHHSAEVLTPLTRFREHFLEAPIDATFRGVALGLVTGVFAWAFAGGITHITVMNVMLLSFLFTLNSNFRHYHVCLRYPRWLEYWLQSPGMHHTHHSRRHEHWDSNLALVTSIWDRLYGTLYIAEPFEATPWGLPEESQRECRTLRQNLVAPFRDIYRIVRGRT